MPCFDNPSFFSFFHNNRPNLTQILPLQPHNLCSFGLKYSEIQLLLIMLFVLKRNFVKPLAKNCLFLGPT